MPWCPLAGCPTDCPITPVLWVLLVPPRRNYDKQMPGSPTPIRWTVNRKSEGRRFDPASGHRPDQHKSFLPLIICHSWPYLSNKVSKAARQPGGQCRAQVRDEVLVACSLAPWPSWLGHRIPGGLASPSVGQSCADRRQGRRRAHRRHTVERLHRSEPKGRPAHRRVSSRVRCPANAPARRSSEGQDAKWSQAIVGNPSTRASFEGHDFPSGHVKPWRQ